MWSRAVRTVPILVAAFIPALFGQKPCASLAQVKLDHAEITSAVEMDEGPLPGTGKMPALCIVKAVARPTNDSEIQFQVWLPLANWNGKFEQVGNGGWAGTIPASAMIDPLRRGYATAGTDDGHRGGGGAGWAMGHPQKLVDFGYRAVHETSVQAHASADSRVLRQGPFAQLISWASFPTEGPRGSDGSAALPGRVRRNHSRRACELLVAFVDRIYMG